MPPAHNAQSVSIHIRPFLSANYYHVSPTTVVVVSFCLPHTILSNALYLLRFLSISVFALCRIGVHASTYVANIGLMAHADSLTLNMMTDTIEFIC